jgi:hypothetical protein
MAQEVGDTTKLKMSLSARDDLFGHAVLGPPAQN